ncbi:MAG TPA: glycosyltransferase family 4 protein [Bryobacteraceae bacterium]|nr:glycosyltransferase family 4 protein [Bryobacteraceae bacterium]
MKILWLKTDFLHPTQKGGQIRTLEMLKRLRQRHEIHYVALDDGAFPESVPRAAEYSTRAYAVPHRAPPRLSLSFAAQLAANFFSPLPLSLARYRVSALRETVQNVLHRESPDAMVCDFLTPAVNLDDLAPWILFQHNVETMIWRRHAETAADPLRKAYFRNQADKMFRVEGDVCRRVRKVIAVSPTDSRTHQELFGLAAAPNVPTGVDVESLTPSAPLPVETDLVFVGSMDWMPNIDGIIFFLDEILPLIRRKRPQCSLTIAGRQPPASLKSRAAADPMLRVTGTVADVRPYLWSAAVSIVPLRVGGGTRLKIYESMAAKTPVVSTSIGAEGLDIHPPRDIRIADTPEAFAEACLDLLDDAGLRRNMADAAWSMVSSCYSWQRVADEFERLILS